MLSSFSKLHHFYRHTAPTNTPFPRREVYQWLRAWDRTVFTWFRISDTFLTLQELKQLPETSSEFYRDWRRCMKSCQEQYQFLLQLGPQNLGQIFREDVAFGLLGEFLTVLSENVGIKDRESVMGVLESLSGTKRFGLNVELLSRQEKESCRHLFEKLQRMETVNHTSCQSEGSAERRLMELMQFYQVP